MNPIEHILHFINILMACTALHMDGQKIGGQTYQVKSWACQTSEGIVTVRAWAPECRLNGYTTYGRTTYINVEEWHLAFYMNRFGGWEAGQGALLSDAYQPPCGS